MRTPKVLWVAVPTALFLLLVSVQIFGPRPIGVADNNDFAKVFGTLGIWAAPEFAQDHHLFFVTDYRIDETRTWDAGMPSSEYWIALAAKQIGKLILPPGHFDIRILGALHALLSAAAFALCLVPLSKFHWSLRVLFTAVFLLIFSDAEYVQFFNTAYMDAGSQILLMLLFAVGWNTALDNRKTTQPWALSFCFLGALFLGTKLQHQLCLIPLVLFCLLTALRTRSLPWLIAPVAMIVTTCFMVYETPVDYLADSRFSVFFTKVIPMSHPPEPVLRDFDRPLADLRYAHWNAYSPGSPLIDSVYRTNFIETVTSQKLAVFYLHHPAMAFQILRSDFLAFSPEIPVANFGTMRRSDNPRPVFRAPSFTLWSDLRSRFCWQIPVHIPMLYALVLISAFFMRHTVGIGALALAISMIGILSFALGSLYDATETSRHIMLYQETTDMLFIIALYLLLNLRLQLPERRILK